MGKEVETDKINDIFQYKKSHVYFCLGLLNINDDFFVKTLTDIPRS
jgi:hypothetical protein